MKRRKADDHVLGARHLSQFDFCIIGSGAGGSTAAHILTAAGKTVLILEAGPNAYPDLDGKKLPLPLHSNDELKYAVRGFISTAGLRRAAHLPAERERNRHGDGRREHAPQGRRRRVPARGLQDAALQRRRLPAEEHDGGADRRHTGACRARLRRHCGDRQLRRLAVHVRRSRTLLRRGRAALRRAGRRHRQSVRVAAQPPVSHAARRPDVLGAPPGERRTGHQLPGRPAQSPHLSGGDRLALHRRRPPALRRLRAVQRLRLPQQLEGRTARDHVASRAPLREVPAALRGAGDPADELGTDGHRGAVHRRRRRAADRHGQRLHPRGQSGRIGAALPALRQPRQLERPGRAEPHVPLPDQRERLPARARARPARPRGHPRHLGLPRRRARRRHHPRGAGRRRAARLHGRHLRVQRVAGSPHHRGRRRLRVPAPRVARPPLRRRTQERVARRGPRPAPVRPHHAGGGRTAAHQHGRPRPHHPRHLRAARPTGDVRPARLREELPRLLRAVPAPGGPERRGAHRCRLRRPM